MHLFYLIKLINFGASYWLWKHLCKSSKISVDLKLGVTDLPGLLNKTATKLTLNIFVNPCILSNSASVTSSTKVSVLHENQGVD